jgi:GH24 family phage-related lysozyme (muramidase)
MSSLFEFVKKVEGFVEKPYLDNAKPPKTTIGYGFNIQDNKLALEALFKEIGLPVEWNSGGEKFYLL